MCVSASLLPPSRLSPLRHPSRSFSGFSPFRPFLVFPSLFVLGVSCPLSHVHSLPISTPPSHHQPSFFPVSCPLSFLPFLITPVLSASPFYPPPPFFFFALLHFCFPLFFFSSLTLLLSPSSSSPPLHSFFSSHPLSSHPLSSLASFPFPPSRHPLETRIPRSHDDQIHFCVVVLPCRPGPTTIDLDSLALCHLVISSIQPGLPAWPKKTNPFHDCPTRFLILSPCSHATTSV